MRALIAALILAGAAAALPSQSTLAQQPAPADGPRFTAEGSLVRPLDFREWVFLTSGLGMTYNEPTGPPRRPSFTNVYVNPSSYRAFMQSGRWPEQTMFILEIRSAATEGSINKGGHFQSDLVVVEASVKDSSRFPGGWAYFTFGREMKTEVAALPSTERCYSCHAEHGAVDNTFVQFYPTALEVATRLGTLERTVK